VPQNWYQRGAATGLNPHPNRSWALSPRELPAGSFYKAIRTKVLAVSQFADELNDEHGAFHRPKPWR
jgi:hypothetical protein